MRRTEQHLAYSPERPFDAVDSLVAQIQAGVAIVERSWRCEKQSSVSVSRR